MMRVSCPASGLKVAFVSCDPLEKGKSQCSCLARELALKRPIHEVLGCLCSLVGSVQQNGRVKESAALACVMQIAEPSLEIDDGDSRVMVG